MPSYPIRRNDAYSPCEHVSQHYDHPEIGDEVTFCHGLVPDFNTITGKIISVDGMTIDCLITSVVANPSQGFISEKLVHSKDTKFIDAASYTGDVPREVYYSSGKMLVKVPLDEEDIRKAYLDDLTRLYPIGHIVSFRRR
jgi:hypothetical protein